MSILVRQLGRVGYQETLAAMQRFTSERGAATMDEIWLLEHDPVFTLGLNADPRHVISAGNIPVAKVDRGGQVTYHGPGQLVAYTLLDLPRRQLGVRALVTALEAAIIATLAGYGISAASKPKAPGVYVEGAKIGSLGLRVRRNCSYHGLALNVDMDLEPFSRINPCGYAGLAVTDIARLGGPSSLEQVGRDLETRLLAALGG